jgi:hypothetical protein
MTRFNISKNFKLDSIIDKFVYKKYCKKVSYSITSLLSTAIDLKCVSNGKINISFESDNEQFEIDLYFALTHLTVDTQKLPHMESNYSDIETILITIGDILKLFYYLNKDKKENNIFWKYLNKSLLINTYDNSHESIFGVKGSKYHELSDRTKGTFEEYCKQKIIINYALIDRINLNDKDMLDKFQNILYDVVDAEHLINRFLYKNFCYEEIKNNVQYFDEPKSLLDLLKDEIDEHKDDSGYYSWVTCIYTKISKPLSNKQEEMIKKYPPYIVKHTTEMASYPIFAMRNLYFDNSGFIIDFYTIFDNSCHVEKQDKYKLKVERTGNHSYDETTIYHYPKMSCARTPIDKERNKCVRQLNHQIKDESTNIDDYIDDIDRDHEILDKDLVDDEEYEEDPLQVTYGDYKEILELERKYKEEHIIEQKEYDFVNAKDLE